jgi:hypothetical protein
MGLARAKKAVDKKYKLAGSLNEPIGFVFGLAYL